LILAGASPLLMAAAAYVVHGACGIGEISYPRAAAVLERLAEFIEAACDESDERGGKFDEWLAEIRARQATVRKKNYEARPPAG
jgi:hypothetical protein